MAKRKEITKKLRFEVFKRDAFTCQYCGRMAPDVILEVDHINPVANGGDNDILNLVTSCRDCNRGKGKRKLSEHDELKKQQAQLKEINEKREQMKLMLAWKEELAKFNDEQVEVANRAIEELSGGYSLNDFGRKRFKEHIRIFGLSEVLEGIEISFNQYYSTKDDLQKVTSYVPRICAVRKRGTQDPWYAKKRYISGILRNRFSYVNENRLNSVFSEIEQIISDVHEVDMLIREAKNATVLEDFYYYIYREYGVDIE